VHGYRGAARLICPQHAHGSRCTRCAQAAGSCRAKAKQPPSRPRASVHNLSTHEAAGTQCAHTSAHTPCLQRPQGSLKKTHTCNRHALTPAGTQPLLLPPPLPLPILLTQAHSPKLSCLELRLRPGRLQPRAFALHSPLRAWHRDQACLFVRARLRGRLTQLSAQADLSVKRQGSKQKSQGSMERAALRRSRFTQGDGERTMEACIETCTGEASANPWQAASTVSANHSLGPLGWERIKRRQSPQQHRGSVRSSFAHGGCEGREAAAVLQH